MIPKHELTEPMNSVGKTGSSDATGHKRELPPAPGKIDLTAVARHLRQHVVFVQDISISMDGAKLDESNIAFSECLRELRDPENNNGFVVSHILFSDDATRAVFGELATSASIPPGVVDGGTNFEAALLEALATVQDFKALPNPDGWDYAFPVVIYMSDGQSHASDSAIANLKEVAQVICVAFGSDADIDMLQRISSDGVAHKISSRGGELRQFLAEVGKTLSQTLQTERI